MHKASLLTLFVLFSAACTQKMICPAYQSSFIYDKEELRRKFSYFKEDSTPKVYASRQTKYLVAVPESFRKKLRSLQTVEMKPVYPVIPDSLKSGKDNALVKAQGVEQDSTAAQPDSVATVYAITKTKEKYNLDQDLYMWYFRKILVMPDVRAAMENKKSEAGAQSRKKGQSKKLGLFRKRDKSDSLKKEDPEPDSSATSKKRTLFGGGKKSKANEPAAKLKEKTPARKEDEDDDDGF